jgi:O-antigen ligase
MQYLRHFEKARLAVMLSLLAACGLLGGASRGDVSSLILLQPWAAICATALMLIPGTRDWPSVRTPLLLLAGLAGIMVAQLIPLPPAVWTSLPGHGQFVDSARVAGLDQPWRPISLTPDLTLAGLVGLIVPLAILVGYASLEPRRRPLLLSGFLLVAAASSFVGLGQISGGGQSPFYTYRVTNLGAAVGLFANRNHQALLLAMSWPMLAVWATMPQRDPRSAAAARWVAGGFALFLLPLLLVTGSRAGLVLGTLGIVGGALLWRVHKIATPPESKRSRRFAVPAIGIVAILVLGLTIALSRAEAVQRLLDLQASEDTRVAATPVMLDIARDFFPVGAGFGSFDPVFRVYEPLSLLKPTYLNHAHNDLLELGITAGLPGILLAAVFLFWFTVTAMRVWNSNDLNVGAAIARLATIVIGLILLSSLVDYPLRTPLMMAIFAIACSWLGRSAARPPTRSNEP